jgi:hypothetical protein
MYVIFNKETKLWGSGKYKRKDQLRIKVKPQAYKKLNDEKISL